MAGQQSMYTESLRAFLKPVLQYLDDDSVSEIMINGPTDIWIERKGKVTKTDAKFSEEGLLGAARNMAQFVGRLMNDERPRLDARLPDGSRIHVVLPPIARAGTTISIRKFFKEKLNTDALVRFGSIAPPMVRLIEAAVMIKLNMIVSGGTGSGKTTLLNILSNLIPNEERILTIEDSAELQLVQDHLVPFESRPADKFGKGEVNMGHLLHSALRLRPDRIIVGEVRGGEAFDLMQAMNTGHGGSMATVHANTPTDTLRRLESLCLMSSIDMPLVAVRAQVASAINFIVCCERLQDGSRKTHAIPEVLPLDAKGEYRTQDLWLFVPVTKDEDGNYLGYHAPTGILPHFLAKARAFGFTDLTEEFFDPATYGIPPPPLIHGLGEHSAHTYWAPSLKHREEGAPDPAQYKEEWREFEEKLKRDAKEKKANGGGAPAKPKVSAAPAQNPNPPRPNSKVSAAPVARPPAGGHDDRTPPPSRNPLLARKPTAESTGDVDATGEREALRAPEPQEEEPLVQVSESLLGDEGAGGDDDGTNVRSYPQRPQQAGRPAPQRPQQGGVANNRTLPPTRNLPPKR
ncbi:MAG: ATPase, T2SS/T4P/T4SS family [Myxococcaceae bacterium]